MNSKMNKLALLNYKYSNWKLPVAIGALGLAVGATGLKAYGRYQIKQEKARLQNLLQAGQLQPAEYQDAMEKLDLMSNPKTNFTVDYEPPKDPMNPMTPLY